MIHLFLIGDVRLNREGLAVLLARDGRVHVTGHAPAKDGGRDAGSGVDVVLIDTAAHGDADAMHRVVGDSDTPMVALGAPYDEEQVIALAELGVLGFVERDASLDELIASVVSAARGEATCPPRIATTLLRRVSSLSGRRGPADASALTMRERQVVQLIAEGMSNKEIAARLCIEVATVKNHVHNILEKLEVNRRSDAVARLRIVAGAGAPARPRAPRSSAGSIAV